MNISLEERGRRQPPAVEIAQPADLPRLFDVWEASVRATHDFLRESDVQALVPLVRNALATTGPLHCLRGADGRALAFMGVGGAKVEMLFVHPDARGSGAGRLLMRHAVEALGATEVDVNEQNAQAAGFYRHLGFDVVGRSPLDPLGNPFPILHMALREMAPAGEGSAPAETAPA